MHVATCCATSAKALKQTRVLQADGREATRNILLQHIHHTLRCRTTLSQNASTATGAFVPNSASTLERGIPTIYTQEFRCSQKVKSGDVEERQRRDRLRTQCRVTVAERPPGGAPGWSTSNSGCLFSKLVLSDTTCSEHAGVCS